MKRFSRVFLSMTIMAVLPAVAGAVGTYYDGNTYQNPQSKYSAMSGGNGGGFYNNYGAGRGYGQNMRAIGTQQTTIQTTTKKTTSTKKTSASQKQGFQLGVDVNHEFANWDFKMKTAGSRLHYDDLRWNVINGEAAYYFGDSTKMQVKVGGKYGSQYGESSMIDDDISEEASWEIQDGILFGAPALSVGTSKDGSQMGFNVSFGLTDFFSLGRVKLTPSVGYRYFKYKVETKNNYGMAVEVVHSNDTVVNCLAVDNGEIQCSPYVGFLDSSGNLQSVAALEPVYDINGDVVGYVIQNDMSAPFVDVGGTYYFEQSGTSHKYQTEWAGPYIALDMEYAINADNSVTAGVEFGLPIYESKGDQPYRPDWAHPTSVEDKGDFGDAYHLGLTAMWSTALTDSVMLSLGMTYDYYHISNADAKTYLNATAYQEQLDIVNEWIYYYNSLGSLTEEQLADLYDYEIEKAELEAYRSNGWAMESKSEIESVYKSMGIRLGLNVKF